MSFLHNIAQWLANTLEPYGAPGLMLIAIADSSFLSLPEVNDAALMALSINNPSRMWELAAMTVLGSVIGCTVLYVIGRKGGEALLGRRFAADKVQRVRRWYQKYGMLAVIVPSLLPPPLPFKIFVLSAGAFQIPWPRFLLAVSIGRSIRYFSEGLVAVWYGKQALQIVAANFAIVGVSLAAVIVAGSLIYVYARRRKPNVGMIILPLILALLSPGCTKTVPVGERMLPWVALTRQQALAKLESVSTAITSMRTTISLSGSTPSLTEEHKRHITPVSLDGTLNLTRSNRISLVAGKLLTRIFEMVSDGTQYEVYNNGAETLYVAGREEGPPSKPIPSLGDLANQFVGMKPRRIHEALIVNVESLLRNPSVLFVPATEIHDRKHFLVGSFIDNSLSTESRLLQRIWFDLTTPNMDIVRRQTYTRTGDLDTDVQYSDHESVSDTLRYPSTIEIHLYETDTALKITLDPKDAEFNKDIDEERFQFPSERHKGSKTLKFEPREPGTVTEQR